MFKKVVPKSTVSSESDMFGKGHVLNQGGNLPTFPLRSTKSMAFMVLD